jgi:hypothetical protein
MHILHILLWYIVINSAVRLSAFAFPIVRKY